MIDLADFELVCTVLHREPFSGISFDEIAEMTDQQIRGLFRKTPADEEMEKTAGRDQASGKEGMTLEEAITRARLRRGLPAKPEPP